MNSTARSRLQFLAVCLTLHVSAQSLPASARAQSYDQPSLINFHRESWNVDDGAPSNIRGIAQTPDGFIWLAADDGLWRFDGISFDHLTGPDVPGSQPYPVSTLFVSRKGVLWVGFAQGAGVARYERGRLIDMELPRPPLTVTNIFEGPDGAIYAEWGGIAERLWRWKGGGWQQVDVSLGLPAGYTLGLMTTGDGAIWAPVLSPDQTQSVIARMGPSDKRFRVLAGHFQFPRLFVDAHQQLWVSDRDWLRRYRTLGTDFGPLGPTYPLPFTTSMRFVSFDRWGGAWSTAWGSTDITRSSPASGRTIPPPEKYRWPDLADTDTVNTSFVDAQGTVWVADSLALRRFRIAEVAIDPLLKSGALEGIQLAVAGNGDVYAASRGELYSLTANKPPRAVLKLKDEAVFCAGRGNEVMLSQAKKVYAYSGTGALRYVMSEPTSASACALDAQGRLWLRGFDGTTWLFDKGRIRQLADLTETAKGGLLGLSVNAAGDIAVPLAKDTVAIFSGNRRMTYNLPSAGGKGLRGLSPGLGGFVAFTSTGPVRLAGGRAVRLDFRASPWARATYALTETRRGDTWLLGPDGLSKVRSNELALAFDHPGQPVRRRLFNARDGLAGQSLRLGIIGQRMVVGSDGWIRIARTAGLASIDPQSLTHRSDRPQVVFRSLTTDNTSFVDPGDLILPSGTRSVRITFSATGVLRPDLVDVRFRLEGVDAHWVEAAQRRATSYTNLAPGTYNFVVMAEGESGGWVTRTLSFEIPPTFFQSWYFKLLCGLAIFLLGWLGYRLRVGAISRNISARLAERHDERERIARELHDTLLQSVQALLLDFRLAAASLPRTNNDITRLDDVIEHAEEVIAEGRDRVHNLRTHLMIDTLEPQLRGIAGQYGLSDKLSIKSYGAIQPLVPAVAQEIASIAAEALFNISRHAKATSVAILINYLQTTLTISFIDNGVGIDHAVIQAGHRPGHFGLVGMQERARKLGGQMLFDRGEEGGAEVTILVPAAVAFQESNRPLHRVCRRIKRWLFLPRPGHYKKTTGI